MRLAEPLPRVSRGGVVGAPSKARAISTVRSVEPSLTTTISSINSQVVRTWRTSAIVFSSLYAAMIAEIPTHSPRNGHRLQPADHNTPTQSGAALAIFPAGMTKRPLVLASLLTGLCIALAVLTLSISGCSALQNLNIVNPSYSLRAVDPHINLAIPPSMDFDLTVGVDNPNAVGLRLDQFDFNLLVNGNKPPNGPPFHPT